MPPSAVALRVLGLTELARELPVAPLLVQSFAVPLLVPALTERELSG